MTASTGVGPGGKRPGAGRPVGSTNHRVRKLIIEAERAGKLMPLDFLLELMRDDTMPLRDRTFCAVAALPFCYPKLSLQRVPFLDPDTLSDEELLASVARLEALAEMTEPPPFNPAPGAVVRPAGEWHSPAQPEVLSRRPDSDQPPPPSDQRRLRYDPIAKKMV